MPESNPASSSSVWIMIFSLTSADVSENLLRKLSAATWNRGVGQFQFLKIPNESIPFEELIAIHKSWFLLPSTSAARKSMDDPGKV